MKKVFLFTNSFPYLTGETYIESELKELIKHFDYIYIFSIISNEKKDSFTRDVPCDIKVFSLNCKQNPYRNLLKGIFVSGKKYKLDEKINFKKWIRFKYLLGRKKTIYNRALKIFKQNNLDPSNSIFYSYWLSFAPAIEELANNFKNKGYKNIKVISRTHRYDLFWEEMPYNFAPLQKQTIKNLDMTYSVSEKGMLYLQEKYPNLKDKISLCRLGTLDRGLANDYIFNSFTFVTCSSNAPVKRVPIFAKAFSMFLKDYPSSVWHCIGIDDKQSNLKQYFNDKELKENVKFYGIIQNEDVYEFYKKEDVTYFVNISSSEGLPVSIMEAISFGIPCIATDVGGTSEIVDSNDGYLLNVNVTSEELYEILKKMCTLSKDIYLKMRKNAREKWDKTVNADKNYDEWCKELKRSICYGIKY